mgnify:CR=1 FL=1
MNSYEIIKKKKNNLALSSREIIDFLNSFQMNEVKDYQMSAFLMAVCFNGLSNSELSQFVRSIIDSGERLKFPEVDGPIVDKHSTGGIGDKVSIILAPLLASSGAYVPMIAGRGLGHTGGTIDKLESIPDYNTNLSIDKFKDNVLNIAIDGSYDDCQRLAKELLQENPFNRRIISLNSINWLRVMGQVAYYVWLTKQFTSPINVAIPSGNFGNAYSAWYGRSHGLPIQNILCSTNINDVLKRFIDTGILEPKETHPSVAPSMDIQIPSSLERLIYDLSGDASEFYKSFSKNSKAELDEKSFKALKHIFSSFTFKDDEIKNKISDFYSEFDIIFDPHTATSVSMGVENSNNINTVAVATASPEKFANTISESIKDYQEVNIDKGEEYIELDVDLDSIVDSVKSKFK